MLALNWEHCHQPTRMLGTPAAQFIIFGGSSVLARRLSSRPKDGHFSEIGDFRRPVLGGNLRTSVVNVTKQCVYIKKLTFLFALKSCFSLAGVFFFSIYTFFSEFPYCFVRMNQS